MPIKYEIQRVRVNADTNTVIITGTTLSALENVGSGAEIYKGLSGTTAQLRTLTEGAGITLTQSANEILIESSASGDFVTTDEFTGYTASTEIRLEGIESDVAENSDSITANTALINENTTYINAVSAVTETNATNISGNSVNIVTLAGEVLTLSGETINKLDSVVGGDNIGIDNTDPLNPIINFTGATGDYVETDVFTGYTASTQVTLDGLRTDVDSNSGATVQNASDIGTVSADTITNTNNIATISGDVIQNTSDIQLVSGVTETNSQDIATLSGDTAQLRIDVDANSGATIQNAADILTLSGETINKLDNVSGGTGISIDYSDPLIPLINYSGHTGATWGEIGGVLSAQTDLQTALDDKVDTSEYNNDLQIISDDIQTNADGITANTALITEITAIAITGVTNLGTGTTIGDKVVSDVTLKSVSVTKNLNISGDSDNIIINQTGFTWGQGNGDIADQADLVTALDSKVDQSQYNDDMQTISDEIDLNTEGIDQNILDIAQNTSDIQLVSGVTENNTLEIAKRVFRTGDTMTGVLEVPQLNFDTGATPTSHVVGSVHWNTTDGTTERHLDNGVTLQDGQEIHVFGIAAEDISNGEVVFPTTAGNGDVYFGLAPAIDSLPANTLGMATQDALSGETIYVTNFGKVRDFDLSAFADGDPLYLDPLNAGQLTNVVPQYPDPRFLVAGVLDNSTGGTVIFNAARDFSPELNNIQYYDEWFTANFVEKITMNTYVSGGTIYQTVENAASGETSFSIIWGTDDVVEYSAQTIALIAGTDTVPVMNFVSMAYDGIQVNTSYFTGNELDTTGEYCAISTTLCQSAASVDLDEPYKVHGWIDRMETLDNNRGGAARITERQRQDNARWSNGVLQTFLHTPGTPDRIDISVTEGIIYQANRNLYPILTTVGDVDPIYWWNNETTPYEKVTNLGEINTLSDGSAIGNNDWTSIVVWGCSSQNTDECKLFANSSNGDYNTEELAVADAFNYSVFDLPDEMRGTGFLIARIVVKGSGGELTELGTEIDLRGQQPNTSAGGTASAGGTIAVKNSLEQDVDLAYQLTNDVVTPTNGQYYGYSGGTRGWFVPSVDTSAFLPTSTFNTYTGDTETRLVGIESDVSDNATGITELNSSKSDKIATISSVGSYTIIQSDSDKIIEVTGTSTITLPVSITIGTQVVIINAGSDSVTLAAGASATLNTKSGDVTMANQYGAVTAYVSATDTWTAFGDLTT